MTPESAAASNAAAREAGWFAATWNSMVVGKGNAKAAVVHSAHRHDGRKQLAALRAVAQLGQATTADIFEAGAAESKDIAKAALNRLRRRALVHKIGQRDGFTVYEPTPSGLARLGVR